MSAAPDKARAQTAFLAGGGDAGALIRGIAWPATPLGELAQWPPALKLGLMLVARQPMFIAWGRRARCPGRRAAARTLRLDRRRR